MQQFLRTYWKGILGAVFLVFLFGVGIVVSGGEAAPLLEPMRTHPVIAPFLYLVFVVASVVAAPFSSLPLIPFAAAAWGIPLTASLNIVGWWIGAVIAFELSRWFGRPLVSYFVSLQRVDHLAARLSGRATFFSIVLLRMVMPVEIPSYALGLIYTVRRSTHAAATFVGIIPFAIVFTVIGDAVIAGQWVTVAGVSLAGVLLLFVAWYVWRM